MIAKDFYKKKQKKILKQGRLQRLFKYLKKKN